MKTLRRFPILDIVKYTQRRQKPITQQDLQDAHQRLKDMVQKLSQPPQNETLHTRDGDLITGWDQKTQEVYITTKTGKNYIEHYGAILHGALYDHKRKFALDLQDK